MKFPQGEGSAVIHRKKKQTCFTKTWHFDCLFSVFVYFYFFIGNLLNSSPTQFSVVLFFLAFYTAPFSSKHFILGIFVRSLSTQLFFLVVLLLLLLSIIAFSYVGLLSLFWVSLFQALCLSSLPPSSFLEGLSSEQFAELRSVHLLASSARACSLVFLSLVPPFLTVCRVVFIYLVLCGRGWGGVGGFLGLSLFGDSVDLN